MPTSDTQDLDGSQNGAAGRPFGPPAVVAVPLVQVTSAATVSADRLVERLRAAGATAAGLLAERDRDGGHEHVLVAARCLLRVELRGSNATIDALQPDVEPLLDALVDRLQGATRSGDRVTVPAAGNAPAESLGVPDDEVLRAPSCFDVLRCLAGLLADSQAGAPVPPGLLGAFGYELIDRFEDLGERNPDPLDEPDYSFVLVSDAVVFDGAAGTVTTTVRGLPWERAAAVQQRARTLAEMLTPAAPGAHGELAPTNERTTPTPSPAPFDPAFGSAVETLLHHIRIGDIFQAVLSRPVALEVAADPVTVLRALGPDAPWRFVVALADGDLIGASPETCLRVENGELELRPLAGTLPRGFAADGSLDPDLDRRLGVQLLLDQKEQAEHAMLVDLARNDVARVSEPGSTELVEAFTLLHMPRVQHIGSRVRGRLRQGLDALHAYRAVANMGTLTGAPKPKAMQLVRSLEATGRGFYGGAVGFLGGDGTLRTCIAIRTLRHEPKTGRYHARAGAGIVHDSIPENEFAETEHKLAQLRRALAEVTS